VWHTDRVPVTPNTPIPSGGVVIVLAALETAGWGRARCCEHLGIDPIVLEPGRLIPIRHAAALLELALEVGGPDFGQTAGRRIPYGAMGLLDHLFGAAPTPRAALTDLCRYFRLVSYAVSLRLDGDALSLELSPDFPAPHRRLLAELFFTLLVTRLSERSPVAPVRAGLLGPLTFPAGELDRSSASADDALRGLLDGYAARELEQVPVVESVRERVRQVVLGELPQRSLAAGEVAGVLGLSDRSLRRALKAEGTTFREVRDRCMCSIAERALTDPARNIGEVGWLLGYSEPSAFHRAFRRWTGITPQQFRERGRCGQ